MAKSPKLRAYQRTAIESARRALTKSGSCILQMPTGAGKTRAATEIVATSRGVIWFVCHRQEIERQVARAFTAAGIDFGVVSPRGELQPQKRVQIASVHSLPKRIKNLPAPKLVIWDECHHAPAKSWDKIRAKLEGARHLGLTATPERLDGKGLGEWFVELVTGPGISDLIKRGYLSEFRYFAPSDPDLTNAKLQAGDYKKADLGRVMNTPVLIGDAVREYKKNAKGKRALAFCASKEAARDLAAKFNAERIPAKHVHDKTPAKERDSAIEDLAAGRIKVLCNVEVFTEGFDLPAIDAVILMRPTKSPTLLLQMIGRGLRKAKGKDVAIIMDHAGLHRDHAWFADDWQWSLDGGAAKARRAAVARGPRRCPECKEVRAEREPVCSCGYEFPTGREIGEFDGVLTEVRGVVPEGWEDKYSFGKRMCVAGSTVLRWIDAGMPCEGRLVHIETATRWFRENVSESDLTRRRGGRDGQAPDGFETRKEFAERFGTTRKAVKFWIEGGLPSHTNGIWVDRVNGIKWVKENINLFENRRRRAAKNPPDGYENKKIFMSRFGLHPNVADKWMRGGMPHNPDMLISVAPALQWVMNNVDVRAFETRRKKAIPPGHENLANFSRRIGCNRHRAGTLKPKGLPCSPDGHVHIQRGLEWVRDNTDIAIPKSAWPKKAVRVKRKMPPDELRPSL